VNEDRKVYISNKGAHDYSDARKFGELVFLTDHFISPFSTGTLFRTMQKLLINSEPDDFLLLTSYNVINAIASSLLALKHGNVNFLLFNAKTSQYVERTVVFEEVRI
jgi:hypothetical protein